MIDEIADATVPETRDTSSEPGRPRFRLLHLFVLTAVMAVMLAISGRQYDYPDDANMPPLLQQVTTGWGVVFAILNAVAVTVTGYGIYWRKHGQPFFHQPGHWLLLAMAISALVGVVQAFGFPVAGMFMSVDSQLPSSGTAAMFAIAILSLLFVAVQIGLNIYFGRKQSERRWRWVFYLKAIAPFFWAFGQLFLVFWLVRTIMIDRRIRVPRDAAHKCGVALELAADTLLAVMFAGMMVFFFSQFRQ